MFHSETQKKDAASNMQPRIQLSGDE
jgi:hypothetical protein